MHRPEDLGQRCRVVLLPGRSEGAQVGQDDGGEEGEGEEETQGPVDTWTRVTVGPGQGSYLGRCPSRSAPPLLCRRTTCAARCRCCTEATVAVPGQPEARTDGEALVGHVEEDDEGGEAVADTVEVVPEHCSVATILIVLSGRTAFLHLIYSDRVLLRTER